MRIQFKYKFEVSASFILHPSVTLRSFLPRTRPPMYIPWLNQHSITTWVLGDRRMTLPNSLTSVRWTGLFPPSRPALLQMLYDFWSVAVASGLLHPYKGVPTLENYLCSGAAWLLIQSFASAHLRPYKSVARPSTLNHMCLCSLWRSTLA